MNRLFTLIAASALSTAALAQEAPTWQGDIAAQLAAADTAAGWQIAPISPIPLAAKTKADILIESFRDGSTETHYTGNITLKRGVFAEMSTDGTQGLVFPESVEIRDWELGCTTHALAPNCAYPMCGGIDGLVAASSLYLAVDVVYATDGTQTALVTDLISGIDAGIVKIEPEEID